MSWEIGVQVIILYNHVLNVKKRQVIIGLGVKTMDIQKVILHVKHVVQSFEDIFSHKQ